MTDFREVASGLRFPEGPIAMADGSILLVEIERGTLSRVSPNGGVEVVAELGGGPNGAAIGPDGAVYICNNGGAVWHEKNGVLIPHGVPPGFEGGSIQRVDLKTGAFTTLYTECGGHRLCAPNDIVFDRTGNFWFTDLGKTRGRQNDLGALYYASPDGTAIREEVFPLVGGGNGVGLSPDESEVIVAETSTGRVWAVPLEAPGRAVKPDLAFVPGRLILAPGGMRYFDSLAVEAGGRVCVATIFDGGISIAAADGSSWEHVPLPDILTTNICFGGPDLKTAYITLGGTGRLIAMDWPRPGLPLNFLNT